jgi:lipid-binding SYLF domain-containing protein
MKTFILSLMLLASTAAFAAPDRADLNDRIRTLTGKFEEMQLKPDKAIPAQILHRAKGIILLDRTKAGFLFAYQGGGGVAMARDTKTGEWSPAAFLGANEASLGFQVGGEQNFYVILLMNEESTRVLTDPNFELGAAAGGTAANQSGGAESSIHSTESPVLVYSDKEGLFGGAFVKAGAVTPDEKANHIYYGEYVTMADILFGHKVAKSDAAADLVRRINYYATPADSRSVRN